MVLNKMNAFLPVVYCSFNFQNFSIDFCCSPKLPDLDELFRQDYIAGMLEENILKRWRKFCSSLK